MDLTFVVPMRNSEHTIGACLDSIFLQEIEKSFEVIVVDNGSSDNSLKLVLRYPQVKIFHEAQRGAGHARNKGWKNSNSTYVAFVDSDVVLDPNWASTLLNVMLPYTEAVQGQIIPAREEASWLDEFRYQRAHHLTSGTFLNLMSHGSLIPLINTIKLC